MRNDTTGRRDAIDTVAEAFRDAYVEHAGDTGALLHARAVAGSAIADLLAEQAKHETTVRMRIDVDELEADALAQLADAADIPAEHVRRTVDAVIARQGLGPAPALPPVRDLEGCTFCDIAHRGAAATIVYEWPDALAIVPINPVTDGHLIVIPRTHVEDFTEHPVITANVARRAAQLAERLDPAAAWNVITSAGVEATQSVFHLHVHLVPRHAEDGLALPWSPAPVPLTATKCVSCGMRIGYVNYRGHVLGWGCANAGTDDTLALARDLGRALTDLAVRAIDADGTEGSAGDDLVGQFLEGVLAHPRVPAGAGDALGHITKALGPTVADLLTPRAAK